MASLALIEQVESWLRILDSSSYYELLGILEIADESAIQGAFHEFSESFHPDRHRGEPEEFRRAVTKIYQRGAEAYGILRNEKTRARYDVALAQGQLRYNPGHTSDRVASSPDLSAAAKTAGARLFAKQAERALSEGNIEEGKQLLRKALMADGDNPQLKQRAQQLLTLAKNGRFSLS